MVSIALFLFWLNLDFVLLLSVIEPDRLDSFRCPTTRPSRFRNNTPTETKDKDSAVGRAASFLLDRGASIHQRRLKCSPNCAG
nr:hypothetical protein [Tanacetum cinerariifolium]